MSRTQWIDNAKGIAIILVVAAHVWRGLRDAKLLAWTQAFQYLDFTVYSFHMAAFFLLAGLTASISRGKGKGWLRPILELYAVYLFWSFLQTLLMLGLSRLTNGSVSVYDLISVPFHAPAQFWFIYILILFRVVVNVVPERVGLYAAATFFLGASMLTRSESFAFKFSHYLLFFVAGYYLVPRLDWLRLDRTVTESLMATAVTLALSFACMHFGLRSYDSILALPLAAFGMLAIFYCSRAIENIAIGQIFNLLGRYSLPIYILHIIAASGVRILLVRLGITDGHILVLVCTLAGLILPVCAYLAADRFGLEALFSMRWSRRTRKQAKVTP